MADDTTTNAKSKALETESCKLKSRVNYNVTFEYNGKQSVLAPRQCVPIPDKSKLGEIDYTQILVI